ncbi:cystathionine gamma-synthase [Helicobacter jaachi]|uniref:Cystathionine gamma-synthase n=1 Tax=Helicobacter jaachi TaxID=1677920 RepID=A0A4U8T904_9HELI|nr:hypothetical protein [Helicobacter jaachi]TLD96236.1 cystathionine gamma-synthase [Helicobacter jaachi]
MKALHFIKNGAVCVAAALIMSACGSDEAVALNNEQCPESATCLYKQFSTSQSVMPNAYKSAIRIQESNALRKIGEIESSVKEDIKDTLNDIVLLAKKSGFCEGGEYGLNPVSQYKEGAQGDTLGYTLHFDIRCNVQDERKKDYDNLIAAIEKKVNKNTYLAFLIPQVQNVISPEALKEAQNLAFQDALKDIQEASIQYSKMLRKKCSIAQIKDTPSLRPPLYAKDARALNSLAESSQLPIPAAQNLTLTLETKYICK